MKIALLGYGKMGKVIEKIAIDRGHDVVLKIDKNDKSFDISKADVAIDFSVPAAAVGNISMALNNKVPVISGTTGWLDQFEGLHSLSPFFSEVPLAASRFAIASRTFFGVMGRS